MKRAWVVAFLYCGMLSAHAVEVPGEDRPNVAFTQGANAEGAVRSAQYSELCPHADTTELRNVTSVQRATVFAEYGLTPMRDVACTGPGHACYEIDHDCSLVLGCTNATGNLWPQRYDGTPWNAHVKDRLEGRLHAMICAHEIDISDAQQCISVDWIACYKRIFNVEGETP
jgi:hypothetical protein